VAHLEHVAAESGLAIQLGTGEFGGAGAGFGAGAVYGLTRGRHENFEPVFGAENGDSWPAPVHEFGGLGILANAKNWLSCGMQGLENNRQQLTAQFANDRDIERITAKRGHRSPLSMVKVGTLRSICQRAVTRREKSTSSEMISTVG